MAQAVPKHLGTWELVMCVIQPACVPCHREKTGIEGTVMELDEHGNVKWAVPEGAEDLPLFSCQTYDVLYNVAPSIIIRFGAYHGQIIEFRVCRLTADPGFPDQMMLENEGWCVLDFHRTKVSEPSHGLDTQFSLLSALEDGYFSDLTIVARNNKEFAVHSSILQLSAPELDWTENPPPLTGLQEDVLGTILHFLYAECLPSSLSERTAEQCVTVVETYPCLQPLASLCQHYLRNMAIKHEILTLVNDMHTCVIHIIQHLIGKPDSDGLNNNPAKLCFALRQSMREVAIAGIKLVVLCELFSKKKRELTQDQQDEIISYAKSRLPVFMSQLKSFLMALKTTLSGLSSAHKQEIATNLVPEIEVILETLATMGMKKKLALESIISSFNETSGTHEHRGLLARTLHEVLHKHELNRLKSLLQRHTHNLYLLVQRKEGFTEMTTGNKVRSISRSLEQLVEELPVFLLRLEEVANALEYKLKSREFKFCFKVGCSKVSGLLKRLRKHSAVIEPAVTELCSLVARDAFTQAITTLQLLDPTKNSVNSSQNEVHCHTPKHTAFLPCKLNLVKSLCDPPMSRNSRLSSAAIQLLRSGQNTDMVFEVIPSPEGGDSCGDTEEACSVTAHRVIVAARCLWFRRALLSGMKEDIDRKIIVYDTSPAIFTVLLDYLYCGQLDPSSLTPDQLSDLIMLADRYHVESLKMCCELALIPHIDLDSVLFFLSIGDQFNAKHLRNTCLNFIAQNPEIMDSELFDELPHNLQVEVYDVVMQAFSPSKANGDLLGKVEEMTANLELSQRD